MLSNVAGHENLRLTLTNATIGALADESTAWPQLGNLILDGFVYGRFSGPAPKDSKSRLGWLALQVPFAPQPYRQVAQVLMDEGETQGSVKVLYEMERQIRARENRWWRTYVVNPVMRSTIGYGYYPTKAFWWLAGIVLLGFALYGFGYRLGSVAPTDSAAYAVFKGTQQLPAHYQGFNAFIYSIENSLPFVKLGQIDRWQVDPHPQRGVWRVPVSSLGVWMSFAGLLRCYQWVQILSGWILGTLFIAGVTGVTRKD